MAFMKTVETIRSARRASALIQHPLRTRILARAQEAVSASALARALEQPRQRVNYHVRQLAAAGLLQPAGQQRRRNMVEQQYVASARSYVLLSELLGEVAAQVPAAADATDPSHLLLHCAQAQSEVAELLEATRAAGIRVRTLLQHEELHFESAQQRTAFMREVTAAVDEVIARYAATDASRGSRFRLLVGCYPVPV
ncbi:MAG TPA: helix-turn-helix domain-containing protein [Longimicrobiales bacterium]|nr:helix-turn-helix domain-containing protein [Longimicrobiales bacterium]